jgi:hypothetical protein
VYEIVDYHKFFGVCFTRRIHHFKSKWHHYFYWFSHRISCHPFGDMEKVWPGDNTWSGYNDTFISTTFFYVFQLITSILSFLKNYKKHKRFVVMPKNHLMLQFLFNKKSYPQ